MRQKGFTLIELMIVVMIIGILAAVAIPQFVKLQAEGKARQNIEKGIDIRVVEDEQVRKAMMKMLRLQAGEDAKIAKSRELQEKFNNTARPVLKETPVPQSDINTVLPVLNKFPKKYTHIDCGGDGLIKGCTLLFRQGDNKFVIPMACELTDSNTYVCEVR